MAASSEQLQRNKAFLLLRYTLIAATAYLILVENKFSTPPLGVVLAITAALLSNVLATHLPARVSSSSGFGLAVIVADTAWITAALIASGHFDAEFFYLYFFVLLLAAIGENLMLIAVGAVVVSGSYLYALSVTESGWSLWNSPTVIRIPFLFAAAAFYVYLVDRTRATSFARRSPASSAGPSCCSTRRSAPSSGSTPRGCTAWATRWSRSSATSSTSRRSRPAGSSWRRRRSHPAQW